MEENLAPKYFKWHKTTKEKRMKFLTELKSELPCNIGNLL